MSFGAVAVGVGSAVAGAAVSSALAPSGGGAAAGAAAADPFASQRPQYQTMLQAMMTGKNADGTPYSFQSSDPSYQFRYNQGLNSTNAAQAAMGNLNSGNRLMALEDYGQNAASQEYANQFSRLSQLSGANVGSPAAAGQIYAQQGQIQQAGASNIGNQIGGAVGKGIGSFFDSGSGGGTGFGGNTYGFSTGMSGTSVPDGSYGSSTWFGV